MFIDQLLLLLLRAAKSRKRRTRANETEFLAAAADEVTWHKVIERQTSVATTHIR